MLRSDNLQTIWHFVGADIPRVEEVNDFGVFAKFEGPFAIYILPETMYWLVSPCFVQ